jgi:hypothetical protein
VTPASLITETLKALTLMTLKHWWLSVTEALEHWKHWHWCHWSTGDTSVTEAPKNWEHWHWSTEALTTSVHRLLLTYQTYFCQYRSVPWCRQCFSDAESSVFRWYQCQCFQCFSDSVTLSHQCFSDISVGAFSVSVLQWRWGHRCALSVSVGDKSVSALSIYTDTAHP